MSFEKYCLSVFGSVMRTSIVYGMFALGLAVIIWIFNILIFDTDDFILRIEALLACGLYIPGLIDFGRSDLSGFAFYKRQEIPSDNFYCSSGDGHNILSGTNYKQ